MDYNINNLNNFKQELKSNLAEFINDQGLNENFKILQIGRDLGKIYVSEKMLKIKIYRFEKKFQKPEQGKINLVDDQDKPFDLREKSDFDVEIKSGLMWLGLKENNKIINVFIGSFGFPSMALYQLKINKKVQSKFIFNADYINQIQFHPQLFGIVFFIANQKMDQYFYIYQFIENQIVCLFEKKTSDFLRNKVVNFCIQNYFILFSEIGGRLISIDFSPILNPENCKKKIQHSKSLKTKFLEYGIFQLELTQVSEWVSPTEILYFDILPINDENCWVFFSSDKLQNIFITRVLKHRIFRSQISYQHQISNSDYFNYGNQCQIRAIPFNNPSMNSFFYYCNHSIIVIDISEPFSIKSYQLEDSQIKSIFNIDYGCVQFLILQQENQLYQLQCDLLQQPKELKIDKNVNSINDYFESKRKIQEIRSFLLNQKRFIKEEQSEQKINNYEGRIYQFAQSELKSIIQLIQSAQTGDKVKNNEEVLKIYQQFNKMFSKLNYEENQESVISCKLEAIKKQEDQCNKIKKQFDDCKKKNEDKLRKLLINKILEK